MGVLLMTKISKKVYENVLVSKAIWTQPFIVRSASLVVDGTDDDDNNNNNSNTCQTTDDKQ